MARADVVGVIRGRTTGGAIGPRAEIDASPFRETTTLRHLSAAVVGEPCVVPMLRPSMGDEDFSLMLDAKPDNSIMLDAGSTGESSQGHGPECDFNDDLLRMGASDWAALAEQLPMRAS